MSKKNIFCIFLIFTLLILVSCTNSKETQKVSISNSVENTNNLAYVSDMDTSDIAEIKLPLINESLLNYDTVSEFNIQTKKIYDEIKNLSADFYFSSDYKCTVKNNIFSLCLRYKSKNIPYIYKILNIDISTGKEISPSELYTLMGFSSSEVRNSVKTFSEAVISAYDNKKYIKSKDNTIELGFKKSLILYDTCYSSDQLQTYIDDEGLVIILPVYNIEQEDSPNYYLFRPSKTSYITALNKPCENTLASVINNVTKEEKSNANIIDDIILPKISSEENHPTLFVALNDNTKITITSGTTNVETLSYIPTKTLLSKTLNRGESIYVEAPRSEIKPPEICVTFEQNENFSQYFITYNSMFENLKTEYVINNPLKPDIDSSMADLAVARIFSTGEENNFYFTDEITYWNSIILAISKYHRPDDVENGEILISESELKRYAASLFPDQKELLPLNFETGIKLGITYNEKSKIYSVKNVLLNDITYSYKSLENQTGLKIEVTDNTKNEIYNYTVLMEKIEPYAPSELIKFSISSITKN